MRRSGNRFDLHLGGSVLAGLENQHPIKIKAVRQPTTLRASSAGEGSSAKGVGLLMGERYLRTLFESQPEGVAVLSANGLFIDANPAAERILGLSRAELLNLLAPNLCFRATDAGGKPITDQNYPVLISLVAGKTVLGCVIGLYNPTLDERRWIQVDAIPHIYKDHSGLSEVFAFFSDVTDKHMREIMPPAVPKVAASTSIREKAVERMSHLSARERQVLRKLVDGDSNKIIAFALGISPRTVEVHRSRMMLKLEVRRFADAIRIAINAEAGISPPDDVPDHSGLMSRGDPAERDLDIPL